MEVVGSVNEPLLKPLQGKMSFSCEQETDAFANKFSSDVRVPLVIWLEGDLGAGKTTFARALIHALGYQGRVKSPTYCLLEQYQISPVHVIHMDLYRISDPGELEFLALEDLMDDKSILLVEWPDRGGDWLPRPDFRFEFHYSEVGRELHWSACTSIAESLIQRIIST